LIAAYTAHSQTNKETIKQKSDKRWLLRAVN